MPMRTTISPLAGEPRTLARHDAEGKPIFEIRPRYLTPARARLADALTPVASALWGVYCAVDVFNHPHIGLRELITGIATWGIGHVVLHTTIRAVLKTTAEIILTTGALSVRHWLNRREYDRNLIQGFALLHHDKAEIERFEHEFEQRQAGASGNVIAPTPYFMRSFHVVAVYAGQRVDVLAVHGQKEARAIAARLQVCHALLNESMGMRAGPARTPDVEWQGMPGGVFHE